MEGRGPLLKDGWTFSSDSSLGSYHRPGGPVMVIALGWKAHDKERRAMFSACENNVVQWNLLLGRSLYVTKRPISQMAGTHFLLAVWWVRDLGSAICG